MRQDQVMRVEPRAWDQHPFLLARTQGEVGPLRPGAQARCQPDLGRPASRDVANSVLLVNHPVYSVLSQPSAQTPPTRRPRRGGTCRSLPWPLQRRAWLAGSAAWGQRGTRGGGRFGVHTVPVNLSSPPPRLPCTPDLCGSPRCFSAAAPPGAAPSRSLRDTPGDICA